jgi:hypothetical protein
MKVVDTAVEDSPVAITGQFANPDGRTVDGAVSRSAQEEYSAGPE